jgi:hypothetical protein
MTGKHGPQPRGQHLTDVTHEEFVVGDPNDGTLIFLTFLSGQR